MNVETLFSVPHHFVVMRLRRLQPAPHKDLLVFLDPLRMGQLIKVPLLMLFELLLEVAYFVLLDDCDVPSSCASQLDAFVLVHELLVELLHLVHPLHAHDQVFLQSVVLVDRSSVNIVFDLQLVRHLLQLALE